MQEYSYGIIPLYKGKEGIEVFIIHQYGSAGDTLWTFPKGKEEQGEVPIETALRELKEETGLEVSSCKENKQYSLSYSFQRNGENVAKTTTYFVGFVRSKDFNIQEEEIKEALWLTPKEARAKLTYTAYKELLDEVLHDLDFSPENS